MNKKLSILFVILLFSAAALGQSEYRAYKNARFGFSISYPVDLLTPQREADNGDGRVFTGEGAVMRVFGSNMLLNETLSKEFGAVVGEHGKGVSYKVYRKNYFVVSALNDGRIFYRKTVARPGGSFITFQIEYDRAQRDLYDKAVEKMVQSFK